MNLSKSNIGVLCALSLFIGSVKAEIAPAGVIIYDEPGGNALFVLKESVEFTPPNLEFGGNNNWIRVRFLADIDKVSTKEQSITLVSGAKVYNPRFKKETAVVMKDTEVIISPLYNDESDKTTTIEVEGFAKMGSIAGGAPIEDNLNALIKDGKCDVDSLDGHLDAYAYGKWIDGEYVSYAVGGDGVRDPSPRPRIILFFYDSKLIAISHKRNFIFSGYDVNEGVRGEYISYSTHLDNLVINRFKKYYKNLMMMID